MIIAAVDDDDHDRIFRTLLERARAKQVKFNRSKLQLKVKQARYCGHLITPDGIQADPDKVKAILEMPAPTDAKGVQRFIGMVNYLSKFGSKFLVAHRPATLTAENRCRVDVVERTSASVRGDQSENRVCTRSSLF